MRNLSAGKFLVAFCLHCL